MKLPVYLDYNATTPVDQRVLEEMLPYFTTYFGNAASQSHTYGWEAQEGVNIARERVAQLINATPDEIIFTSGATESVNLALKGVMEMYRPQGNHIITVNTEHSSVLDTCAYLKSKDFETTILEASREGMIQADEVEAAIRPQTVLICVMYANNETGVIQPIKAISEVAEKHNILFFSDATQAVGKIPVDVVNDGIHMMALSAHKMYGPKGVGALYLRRKNPRVTIGAQLHGGKQEKGWRSGTLNVAGIVGLGKASDICSKELYAEEKRIRSLRDRFEEEMLSTGALVNGSREHRLPNVSNLSFSDVPSASFMSSLRNQLAVSSSSACTQASRKSSRVLTAMFGNEERAKTAIRFSLGRFTNKEQMDFTVKIVKEALQTLQTAEIK